MRVVKVLLAALVTVAVLFGGFALTGEDLFDRGDPSDPEASESADPSDEGSPDPRPNGSQTDDAEASLDPDDEPRVFDDDDATTFSEEPVYDGVVAGDRLLTLTLDRVRSRGLPDLGQEWELSPEGLFVDLFVDGDTVLVLQTRSEGESGTAVGDVDLTLARVSLEGGAVLDEATWELRRDVESPGELAAEVKAVVDDVALVETRGSGPGGRRTLSAIDLASGEEAWSRRPAAFLAVGDGLVVASTAGPDGEGELVALDPENGKEEWTSLELLTGVSPVGVDGTTLVVVKQDTVFPEPTLVEVDLEDGGSEVLREVDEAVWTCHPAMLGRVVCALPGDRVVGYDLREQELTWRLPTQDRYGIQVTSVSDRYVHGYTPGGRPVTLDAAVGRDVSEDAGGAPISSNGYGGLVLYAGRAIFMPAVE